MKQNDQNRMIKEHQREKRDSIPEINGSGREFRGCPCTFCQSQKTEVTHIGPIMESTQYPVSWLRSRTHRCKNCGREFHTTESMDASYKSLTPPPWTPLE